MRQNSDLDDVLVNVECSCVLAERQPKVAHRDRVVRRGRGDGDGAGAEGGFWSDTRHPARRVKTAATHSTHICRGGEQAIHTTDRKN